MIYATTYLVSPTTTSSLKIDYGYNWLLISCSVIAKGVGKLNRELGYAVSSAATPKKVSSTIEAAPWMLEKGFGPANILFIDLFRCS